MRRRSTASCSRSCASRPGSPRPDSHHGRCTMFEAFAVHGVETSRGTIFARVGGHGPVLLLLHGYPQTHLMWHAAAPLLAERLTVVAADLPGYGASFRPAPARSSTSTSAGSGSAPRRTGTR